jgi:hypothetical protein
MGDRVPRLGRQEFRTSGLMSEDGPAEMPLRASSPLLAKLSREIRRNGGRQAYRAKRPDLATESSKRALFADLAEHLKVLAGDVERAMASAGAGDTFLGLAPRRRLRGRDGGSYKRAASSRV